ncbi:MAG: S1/P1 nuclease, partial [Pseudohongiellaceae bacterium]
MKKSRLLATVSTLVITLVFSPTLFAWSSVGHRLTAAVAHHFIDEDTADLLIDLLEQHPRFEEDFAAEMPSFIESADKQAKQQWLLGQAAYWPDIARGLPDAERAMYNRPSWHYEQGEWVRDSAQSQGNHYVGIEPFSDIQGKPSSSIRSEEAVGNLVTAIDYNTWVLANTNMSNAQRAVALCWVLHLMGDIHQPLHTGSLYSAHTFERGDLGGN